jgi:hypothetical protein
MRLTATKTCILRKKCYVPGTDRIGYANVEEHFKNVKHYYCDVHAVHDFCLLGGLPTMLNFSLLVFFR